MDFTVGNYTFTTTTGSNVTIKDYNCSGSPTDITTPQSVSYSGTTYTVTGIGQAAFENSTCLSNVTISYGIQTIELGAFHNCQNLTSVSIPSTVTTIGLNVFLACNSLGSISVDAANPAYSSIAGVLFNKAQTTIITFPPGRSGAYTIPATVTNIGASGFLGCEKLNNVVMPNGLLTTSDNAFDGCIILNNVIIPETVTDIGVRAFSNCRAFTTVTIPSGVQHIGLEGFSFCDNLSTAHFYGNNIIIDAYAFAYCYKLTTAYFYKQVSTLYNNAFFNCTSLTRAYFYEDAPVIYSDTFSQSGSGFKIYYRYGKSGYSNPWHGYTTEPFYIITYEGNGSNGGTVPTDSTIYYSGNEVMVLPNSGNLQKNNAVFSDWNTQADGNGTTYAAGQKFTIGTPPTVTLYAKWTVVGYTVTYNGNHNTGGSAPVDSGAYRPGQPVSVLGNTGNLEKTGFAFAGWNTKADGGGDPYVPGQIFYMGTSDVILYAMWQAVYSVTYNGNGSTGGSAPVDGNFYVTGAPVTVLDKGSLTKTGFTFTGWNTQQDGGGSSYAPGAGFPMPASNMTLYAMWRKLEPKISIENSQMSVIINYSL